MRIPPEELVDLLMSGDYVLVQRKDDWNKEDLRIKRRDGRPAEICNYPYRLNQMPAYLFEELERAGMLCQGGFDEDGGAIFCVLSEGQKPLPQVTSGLWQLGLRHSMS